MRKTRSTEEQIAFALRQVEAGTPVEDICRKLGVSEATFSGWKKQFGGTGAAELRRLKQLEEENKRLRLLVSDLSLDRKFLQDSSQKSLSPPQRRELNADVQARCRLSERRAAPC